MCGPLMQDLVMAALAMQRALELDSDEPQWRAERNRLLSCIPEHTSALLQVQCRMVFCKGRLPVC